MGSRKLFYYGSLVKESGKELFAFLFNDSILMVEANESLQSEIFKAKPAGGKLQQLQLYKQPILLDSIASVGSRLAGSGANSDCCFQIVCGNKELAFKTTNPTLRLLSIL
jgi:hypothetical protein